MARFLARCSSSGPSRSPAPRSRNRPGSPSTTPSGSRWSGTSACRWKRTTPPSPRRISGRPARSTTRRSPPSSTIAGGTMQTDPTSASVDRTRYFDANASLDQLLSTGATASASFTNFWSKDNLGSSASRYAQPELTLSLSQPLLKGLGKRVTERGITTADDAMESVPGQLEPGGAQHRRGREEPVPHAGQGEGEPRDAEGVPGGRPTRPRGERGAGERRSARRLRAAGLRAGSARRGRKTSSTRSLRKGTRPISFVLTLHLPPGTILELPDTPWTDVPDPSEEAALGIALRRRPDLVKARTSLRAPRSSTRGLPQPRPSRPLARGERRSRGNRVPTTGTRSATWGPGRTRTGR